MNNFLVAAAVLVSVVCAIVSGVEIWGTKTHNQSNVTTEYGYVLSDDDVACYKKVRMYYARHLYHAGFDRPNCKISSTSVAFVLQ